jgi:chromosome segregation protein
VQIQKLKIVGFKSFAQKVEVNFEGSGLTGVVGPNGCGKSNIVDAIRWVMGEQRAGQLRMGKMQDVIFSGTEDRPAMNMAEVSLLINNDRGLLPSEYSEIMITRRAYRNGDTEYLINNQECRLKDIQNLFYDTGMGAGAYSQMEQRMIDAILSDKAEDRRVLFEEAAGVSKYKRQRKETIAQLDRVRIDMERVEDNLRHAKTMVRQHERLVAKAEEFKRLRARLRELDLSMSLDKYLENKQNLDVLVKAHGRLGHEQDTLRTRLTELDTKIEEKKLSIADDEEAYRELERGVGQLTLEVNDLNNQHGRLRDRRKAVDDSRSRFEREISESRAKLSELQAERAKLEEQSEGLVPELEEHERLLEREQESLQVLRDSCDDLRTRNRELSNERLKAANQVNSLKGRWQRVDAELEMLTDRIAKAEAELAALQGQEAELQAGQKEQEAAVESARQRFEEIAERRQVLSDRLGDAEAELRSWEAEERVLHQEKTRLHSRLDVLRSMESSAEGVGGGNRWLLDHKVSEGACVLGSQLQADARYLAQIEYCMGEAMLAVSVSDPQRAAAWLEAIDGKSAGPAYLAIENSGAPVALPRITGPGVIDSAAALVQVPASLRNVIDSLLARWILVDDFASALRLAQEHAGADLWFCAPGGRAVHACGWIRGGHGTSEPVGMLQRRSEIESLEADLEKTQGKLSALQSRIESQRGLVQEVLQLLGDANEEMQSLQAEQRGAQSRADVFRVKLQNITQQTGRITNDIANFRARAQTAGAERQSDAGLAEAENLAHRLEEEFASVSEKLEEQEMVLRNKEEDVRDLNRQVQGAQTVIAQNRQRLRSIEEQVRMHGTMADTRSQDVARFDGELAELDGKMTELETRIQARNDVLSEEERKRDAAREKYDVLAGDLEDWRSEVRSINQTLHERAGELHDVEMRIQALRGALDRMRERVFQEHEINLDQPPEFTRVEYDEREAKRELADVREKIKAIGPVNSTVIEDYETEKQRCADVEKQFDDLDRARASLERTIHRLDTIARERFLETFKQIQRNYHDIFSRLMRGGEGKLTLQEGVDPLEAEIEINARPTGKKMRGVKALSGGERALTATALLFALYMVKPSAYCILDEVDGPLDDANIGRFVELLRHFSRQTQFIIVTHNKRTMAASDRLYGVTQEIKGISRVGSVKLEDAVGLVK